MVKLNMKNFHKLLREICEEEGIKVTFLSKGWVTLLEKNNICKFIVGYKFDLNSYALGLVCDDKYAMYELLNYHNIPVVKHHIVYSSSNKESYAKDCNSLEYLQNLFYSYEEKIVLKINNGTCGDNVFLIKSEEELQRFYNSFDKCTNSFSLCPFMNIENEYRVIMLQNKPELIYKKMLPVVYGDGKSTIKELLMEFNYDFFKNYNEDNKDLVLEKKKKYIYGWKFNLSQGAKSSLDISEDVKKEILGLAKRVSKSVGLGFGSVDIIKTVDGKLYVLEVNSGVMMDNFIKEMPNGYDIAKNIYRKAIKDLFI